MTTVEFHILSATGDEARMRHACQLVDECYGKGERCFVRVASDAEAQRMDELLWTFRDQAFIPHEVINTTASIHPNIMALIGACAAPAEFRSRLINLSNAVPDDVTTFTQMIEVVDADAQRKQQARERYKQYRELGCTLETKNL
jgi:DNA polymerase-3 subunit chi